LANYSDSMLELDHSIGESMEIIRAEAPDTIMIISGQPESVDQAEPVRHDSSERLAVAKTHLV
jgi:hypothetical protein